MLSLLPLFKTSSFISTVPLQPLPIFLFLQPNFLTCLNSCLFSHSLNCSSLAFPSPPALFLWNSLVPCHQSNGHVQSFKSCHVPSILCSMIHLKSIHSSPFLLPPLPYTKLPLPTPRLQQWLESIFTSPAPFFTTIRMWQNITNNAFLPSPSLKLFSCFPFVALNMTFEVLYAVRTRKEDSDFLNCKLSSSTLPLCFWI